MSKVTRILLICHHHKLLDLIYFQFFEKKKSDEDLPSHSLNIRVELRMMFSERIVRGTSSLLGKLWRCSLAQISCSQFVLNFCDTVAKSPIGGS